MCAEVGGRIPTFDFRFKKLKILPFMMTNVGKDGTFRRIVVFRLLIHSGLRKLRVEMTRFKKYSSFSEKLDAFVQVKWQISVQLA